MFSAREVFSIENSRSIEWNLRYAVVRKEIAGAERFSYQKINISGECWRKDDIRVP